MCVCVLFTFGLVSMVAGAISVSSMSCFSMALFLVGVELFLFFRDGDGVPSLMQTKERKKQRKWKFRSKLLPSISIEQN